MSPVSSSVRWERTFLMLTEMKGFLPGPLETGQPGGTGGARNIILHFTNSWSASDGSDQGAHPAHPAQVRSSLTWRFQPMVRWSGDVTRGKVWFTRSAVMW